MSKQGTRVIGARNSLVPWKGPLLTGNSARTAFAERDCVTSGPDVRQMSGNPEKLVCVYERRLEICSRRA